MRKYFLTLGVAAFILMRLVSPSFADDNALTKFGRGVSNIVLSPAELYAQPLLLSKDHEPAIAIFGGLLKGTEVFLEREAVGIYEVFTFPWPGPKKYGAIIEPATTFTNWNARFPHTSTE